MSSPVQEIPQFVGTGLIKKLSLNRQAKVKGTIRMLTPAELCGQDCTFLFQNVLASGWEKEFISIGMTMRFLYGGNEVTGYRATELELVKVADYAAVVNRVPSEPGDVDTDEDVPSSSSSTTDNDAAWTGLNVTLDLTLERVPIKARSLRELFTNPETGEIEPCTIKPGDRCLVRIETKYWLEANRDDKPIQYTIVSFLPSNSTSSRPRRASLSAQKVDPPMETQEAIPDLPERKEQMKDAAEDSSPKDDAPSSLEPSLDAPPSDLSPQCNLQPDKRQGAEGESRNGHPDCGPWSAPKPSKDRAWSGDQLGHNSNRPGTDVNWHSLRSDRHYQYADHPQASRSCGVVYNINEVLGRHHEQVGPLLHQAPPLAAREPSVFGYPERCCSCTASCDSSQIHRRRLSVSDLTVSHVQSTTPRGLYRTSLMQDDDDDDEYVAGNGKCSVHDTQTADAARPPCNIGLNQCHFGGAVHPCLSRPGTTMLDSMEAHLAAAAGLNRPMGDFIPQMYPFASGFGSMPMQSMMPSEHPILPGATIAQTVPPLPSGTRRGEHISGEQ